MLLYQEVEPKERSILPMSDLAALSDMQLFLVVVVGPAILMIIGTLFVHRFFRGRDKSVIGDLHRTTFSSVSTILAFLLGFLIVTTWTNYRTADQIVAGEAADITVLARDSQTLPPIAQAVLIGHLRNYTELVMTDEWPLMAQGKGQTSATALAEFGALWSVCQQQGVPASSCGVVQGDLDRLSAQRALRLDSSQGSLPNDLWFVLFVGTIVMLFMSFLFYTHDIPLSHQIITRVLLTVAFATMFWLIITLANPYAGGIHVTPHAYEYPLLIMKMIG